MGKESDAIKKHIDAQREHLGESLDQLEARVKRARDWRALYRKNAPVIIAGAFGAGVLLSLLPYKDARPARKRKR